MVTGSKKIILNGLTLSHFYTCPNIRPGFPMSSDIVFFVFKLEMIVRFVDINGIVD